MFVYSVLLPLHHLWNIASRPRSHDLRDLLRMNGCSLIYTDACPRTVSNSSQNLKLDPAVNGELVQNNQQWCYFEVLIRFKVFLCLLDVISNSACDTRQNIWGSSAGRSCSNCLKSHRAGHPWIQRLVDQSPASPAGQDSEPWAVLWNKLKNITNVFVIGWPRLLLESHYNSTSSFTAYQHICTNIETKRTSCHVDGLKCGTQRALEKREGLFANPGILGEKGWSQTLLFSHTLPSADHSPTIPEKNRDGSRRSFHKEKHKLD